MADELTDLSDMRTQEEAIAVSHPEPSHARSSELRRLLPSRTVHQGARNWPIKSRRRLEVHPDIKADLDAAFRQIREVQRLENLWATNEVDIRYALLPKMLLFPAISSHPSPIRSGCAAPVGDSEGAV